MKKLILITMTTFFYSLNILACPNISGTYQCNSNISSGETVELDVHFTAPDMYTLTFGENQVDLFDNGAASSISFDSDTSLEIRIRCSRRNQLQAMFAGNTIIDNTEETFRGNTTINVAGGVNLQILTNLRIGSRRSPNRIRTICRKQ